VNGAPLIPPNHSLRIKVARSDSVGDNTNDPGATPAQMTTNAVTLWYMITAHQPPIGTYSQFFGQGFGLAMYLTPLDTPPLMRKETNSDLLTKGVSFPNYHSMRWHPTLHQQRVPNGDSGLSRNMLNVPGAPSLATVTPATPP
jgi:hypothetical protein